MSKSVLVLALACESLLLLMRGQSPSRVFVVKTAHGVESLLFQPRRGFILHCLRTSTPQQAEMAVKGAHESDEDLSDEALQGMLNDLQVRCECWPW